MRGQPVGGTTEAVNDHKAMEKLDGDALQILKRKILNLSISPVPSPPSTSPQNLGLSEQDLAPQYYLCSSWLVGDD